MNSFKYTIIIYNLFFDKSGRRPGPENIYAIQRMKASKNLTNLHSSLGLVNDYNAFSDVRSSFEKKRHIIKRIKWMIIWSPYLVLNLKIIFVVSDASSYGCHFTHSSWRKWKSYIFIKGYVSDRTQTHCLIFSDQVLLDYDFNIVIDKCTDERIGFNFVYFK